MSKFKQQAKEIKAAGEARRGDFSPKGIPAKRYQKWLDASDSDYANLVRTGRQKENFCHFWRVVVLWSWLTPMTNSIIEFVDKSFTKHPRISTSVVVLMVIAVLAGLAMISSSMAEGIVVLLCIAALFVALTGMAYGFTLLPTKVLAGFTFTILVLLVVAVIASLVVAEGWIALLIVLGGLLGIGAVVVGVSALCSWTVYLLDELEDKRRIKRWATANTSYDDAPVAPTNKPKKRGIVYRFAMGVRDFADLAWQIVRVNKWKICPLVTIDTKESENV